ncbi:MAG: TonB family protein [Oligoflexus sp.]
MDGKKLASPKEQVKVQIVEKKADPHAENRQQIVEAPLMPTEPPQDPDSAFLGRQDHRTDQEQKLPPSEHRRGAESTRYSSQTPPQAAPPGDPEVQEDMDVTKKGRKRGKIQGDALAYHELLPETNEFAGYHNDFIADDSIPTGEVLDVNTTEYRFIGYFTSVRKQVDFAFYDPRSSLRNQPRIRDQLIQDGRVTFRGVSVAQLTVLRNGMVTDTKIVRSSGDVELDESWLRILNLAAPFPPLPAHFNEDQLVFNYSLYYDFILQDSRQVRRYHF